MIGNSYSELAYLNGQYKNPQYPPGDHANEVIEIKGSSRDSSPRVTLKLLLIYPYRDHYNEELTRFTCKQRGYTKLHEKLSFMATSQEDSKQSSDESYERAERQAKALFNQGFHLGGATRATRDQLHER